jgi:glycosyltransferase involved in cell wall biosynthesis
MRNQLAEPLRNERKRVAIDISHQTYSARLDGGIGVYINGGIGVYITELISAYGKLPSNDFEFVYLRGPKFFARKNKLTKVTNLLIELIWLHVLLPIRLAQERIDLVHMPSNVAPFYSPCPVVVTIHDATFCRLPKTYDSGYRRYARLSFSIAARRATRVVTVSSTSAEDVTRYFGAKPHKLSVVYPGVSHNPNAVLSRWEDVEQPYVLFVGALEPHKNVVRLVEAFALFRTAEEVLTKDYRLLIAGPKTRDTERITAAIARHQLDGVVRLTGTLSQAQRDWLYEHASVFAFPSLNEGFGFPPLEAMVRGVPVVAASAGALPEVLGDASLYFDPFDPNDIARVLSRATFDQPLRARLVHAGLERVGRFTWEKTAAAMLDIYREVLAS